MSTPTQAASLAAAIAAETALQEAANNEFIMQATLCIADAVSQGKQIEYLYSIPGMNFQTVFLYFQNLGYIIGNPSSMNTQLGPAELFGFFWNAYWFHTFSKHPSREPIKLFIAWSITY
jgi:hypothetical protein